MHVYMFFLHSLPYFSLSIIYITIHKEAWEAFQPGPKILMVGHFVRFQKVGKIKNCPVLLIYFVIHLFISTSFLSLVVIVLSTFQVLYLSAFFKCVVISNLLAILNGTIYPVHMSRIYKFFTIIEDLISVDTFQLFYH